MDFDHSEQVRALAALPPEPVRKPPRGMWATVWDGVKAGAAETIATVGKVAKAYGAAQAMADEANPLVQAGVGREAARRGAEQGREIIASGDIETEVGRSFRAVADDLRPDPATATTAENVVFGLGRGLTKAIGSTLALGPAGGAALFGASEADTTFEELRAKGVDAATAGKVAAVTGTIGAGSVVLPMVGSTLKATAGLYLAGGPGGFVAQQAATSAILERANYAEIAKQYDPLDPVGLALSALVPLPFAAVGAVRNIRAGRKAPASAETAPPSAEPAPAEAPVPPEAVDAAMVHNLTLLRDQQEAARAAAVAAEPPPVAAVDAPAVPAAAVEPPRVEAPAAATAPAQPEFGRLTDAVAAARQQVQEMLSSGRTLDEQLAGRQLPPEVFNLAVGMGEALRDPRRMRALLQQVAAEAGDAGKSTVDAAADAVERMRALTDEQLKGVDAKPKPAPDVLMQSVDDRVREIEAARPDLRVSEDATAAEFLARARREAAEGTDAELGALDADLLRVAADCALGAG